MMRARQKMQRKYQPALFENPWRAVRQSAMKSPGVYAIISPMETPLWYVIVMLLVLIVVESEVMVYKCSYVVVRIFECVWVMK